MMKRVFLIFSLVLMTALAGCGNGDGDDTPTGGGETGGETGGSAAIVFNLTA